LPAKAFIIKRLQEQSLSVNQFESNFINFYIELISFGENVFYNEFYSMRSRIFFEAHSKKEVLTALRVKMGRAHSDKVKVRACLPVMWVYWFIGDRQK
jgi:hypothetical protein